MILAFYGVYFLLVPPLYRLGADPLSPLFTGTYPALTWIPFGNAGMAVARLGLTATATATAVRMRASRLRRLAGPVAVPSFRTSCRSPCFPTWSRSTSWWRRSRSGR